MIIRFSSDSLPLAGLGVFLIALGVVQFMRRIKSYHVDSEKLVISRPFMPTKSADRIYLLEDLKKVRFIKLKWGRSGPIMNVYSKKGNADFLLAISQQDIDNFFDALQGLGVETERKGI